MVEEQPKKEETPVVEEKKETVEEKVVEEKPEEIEKPVEEEKASDEVPAATIDDDDNLFDLIDSMYRDEDN